MPELPEVEVTRRAIRPYVEGKRIDSITYVPGKVVNCDGRPSFRDALLGCAIDVVERKGKWMRMTTDGDYDVYVHLGLSGNLAVGPYPQANSIMALYLEDGTTVSYVDQKGYGHVIAHDHSAPFQRWEELGPDALEDDVTAERLSEAFAKSRRAVKMALMDQTLVSGLGNTYVAEILFLAGISPKRRCRDLEPDEIDRLAQTIRPYLTYVTDIVWSQVTDPTGLHSEGIAPYLNVYGREGQVCNGCWGTVESCMQSGRKSYFCPDCQK